MRLMGQLLLYLARASLRNLMAGYAGLVSVGQQAFVGFGCYMLFALTMFAGLHPLAAIAAAGVLGALVSIPVAVLIFRLRRAYFAIGTRVVAEVFRLGFTQISALDRDSGSSPPVTTVRSLASKRTMRESLSYWLALGATVLLIAVDCFFSVHAGDWRRRRSVTMDWRLAALAPTSGARNSPSTSSPRR